jgi:uncharacterized protein DUF6055
MRRPLVVVALVTSMATSLVTTTGLADLPATASDAPDRSAPTSAQQTLTTVEGLLAPSTAAARTARTGRPPVSLAMRDLFAAIPRLDANQRRTARGYLARPTDGASDRLGDGYTVAADKKCRNHVCIHWVPTTADAPPSTAWVNQNLRFMNKVWRTEVNELGYRRPVADRHRGGNAKFDVYLKELGSRGVYGYCAPERRAPGQKWLASGYCVLDNDFAEAQYGAPPKRSLRVTAAHEFFHAIQFAYDYGEDPWLMESTATWMEERVADDVNDNRQYLPYGQVGAPGRPLDLFNRQGFNQYGNWTFFEYLSQRFGSRIVRQVWSRAGAYPGSGHQYSTAAVKSVLAGKRGGFVDVFRRFSAANTTPGHSYPEGGKWPVAPATDAWVLSKADPKQQATTKVDHMASRNFVVRPGDGLDGRRWHLRVSVNGPGHGTSPAAYVVVKRKHGLQRIPVGLSRKGAGSTLVGFNATRVSWAKVVLANASTRFHCWQRTTWSCQGRARDNDTRWTLDVAAVRTRR